MKFISTATNITHAFKNVGRVSEIVRVLVRHGFADIVQRMKLSRFFPSRDTSSEKSTSLPIQVRLRLSFEELGPTFVKLGQLLASRPDLIPEHFVEEFEKLQDNVGSVPTDKIRAFVESELGSPIDEVFSEFESVPMAAASIGQVHGGVLKTGERVAIKIQRPGIGRIIENDISILRGLAILLEQYVPESRLINPVGIVEEFFKTILHELDFLIEANNIRRIKGNLSSMKAIAIPEVYLPHTTHKMLVLERFDGIRFSDRERIIGAGIDPMSIVEKGSDAFFHMVMHDGLFHADLHAGNLFVLPDGRIGIIDFGIVGRLSRRVQDSIITMFTALIDEDYETLASEYLDLCQTDGAVNLSEFQKDLMDIISPYVGMHLGEVNVGQLLLRSTGIATKHSLRVPRELLLLFKALVNIEALGKKLEPDFDILQVGTRQARQILTTRYGKDRLLRDVVVVARDLQILVERLPNLMKRFLRQWAQNNFSWEFHSKDVSLLARNVHQFSMIAVLCTFGTSMTALSITLLVLDRGPMVAGTPVLAILTLLAAVGSLTYGLWSLRKTRK